MPVALSLFFISLLWLIGPSVYAGDKPAVLLYPTQAQPVEMMDVSDHTVAEVVEGLPVGLKFEMLLKRTGVIDRLHSGGPYTVFVPADNHFDYIDLPSYTRAEEAELAERHIISHAVITPQEDGYLRVDGGFAVRGWYAKDGVVYLISRVLVD